jgi:hypothetical protein
VVVFNLSFILKGGGDGGKAARYFFWLPLYVLHILSCTRGLAVSYEGMSLSLLEATVFSYPQHLNV